MSFSTEFYAKTHAAAKARLKGEHLPPTVLAFLLTALDNMEARSPGPVHIKANGHLTSASGDYNRSHADIVVEPLDLVE
jgi:hypothetical protein